MKYSYFCVLSTSTNPLFSPSLSLFSHSGAVCDTNPSCGDELGRDCSSILGSTLPKSPAAKAVKETPIILLVIWLRGTRGSSRFKLLLNIHRLNRTSPARFCFRLLSVVDLTIKLQFQECNSLIELKLLDFFFSRIHANWLFPLCWVNTVICKGLLLYKPTQHLIMM